MQKQYGAKSQEPRTKSQELRATKNHRKQGKNVGVALYRPAFANLCKNNTEPRTKSFENTSFPVIQNRDGSIRAKYKNVKENLFLSLFHKPGSDEKASNIVITLSEMNNAPSQIIFYPNIGQSGTRNSIENSITLSEVPQLFITEYPTGAVITEEVQDSFGWKLVIEDETPSLLPSTATVLVSFSSKENKK